MSDSPSLQQVIRDFLDECDRMNITEATSEAEVKRIARDYADRYGHIEGLFYRLMDAFHDR